MFVAFSEIIVFFLSFSNKVNSFTLNFFVFLSSLFCLAELKGRHDMMPSYCMPFAFIEDPTGSNQTYHV